MKKDNLDVLIAPGLSLPAFPHGASGDLTPSCSYTFLYNLLNFPAGTVPITTVLDDDLVVTRNKKIDMWEKKAAQVDERSVGLPIGVQVISYPFHDESTSTN